MIYQNDIAVKRRSEGGQIIYNASILVEHTSVARCSSSSSFDSRIAAIGFDSLYMADPSTIVPTVMSSPSPALDAEMSNRLRTNVYNQMYNEVHHALKALLHIARTNAASTTAHFDISQIEDSLRQLEVL